MENKKSPLPNKSAISYSALFGFATRYKKPNGTWAFKFRWGRICVLIASMVILAWLALSLFIFIMFRYVKDYDEMTFYKAVVMPFNRAKHNAMVGDYNIRKAKELIEAGDGLGAIKNLHAGVGRSPNNLEGKKMLAWIYSLRGQNDYAIQALDSGFPEARENPEYVVLYVKILLEQAEDKKLVVVASKLLEMGIKNDEARLNLAMATATVYALHGSYSKSNEIMKKYGLDKSSPGVVRMAKNLWEQGLKDDAIQLLKDNISKVKDKESIYSLLMSFYNLMQDYDTARQYAVLRAIENPFSVKQKVDYLKLLSKSGEKEQAAKQIESIFEQYRNDPKSLIYIANFAAVEGNLDLMRRIYETALQRNYPIAPFCLLYLEAMLSMGDFKKASAFVDEIMYEKPLWAKRYDDVLNCLRTVSYYASGNTNMAEIILQEIMKKNTVPVKTLIATARRLDNLGATFLAYRLLESAVDKDPHHQLALTRLVQMDIKIGNSTNLDKNILKLLQMRRPPRELIEGAQKNLGSDRFIYAKDREKIMKEIVLLVTREGGGNFMTESDEELEDSVTGSATESL